MSRFASVLVVLVGLVASSSTLAQPRRTELSVDLAVAGRSTRDLGYVATNDAVRPGFGVGVRVLGRLAHTASLQLHLGAKLGATAWRTDTLRRTEGAFRTTFDPGLVVRGAHGRFSLALTVGPSIGLPAIAELYSGGRLARGAHAEVAFGVEHAFGRLRVGVELAYVHHRLRSPTPEALTTTHVFALRFGIGIVAPDASEPVRSTDPANVAALDTPTEETSHASIAETTRP